MRTRTSRTTWLPTAANIRRIWRFQPWVSTARYQTSGARSPVADPGRRGSGPRRGAQRRPASRALLERDAVLERAALPGIERPGQADRVLALDAVARMEQPLRPVAVVGQQEQTLGVPVEPADRVEAPAPSARSGGHEVEHGALGMAVADGAGDADRLVAARGRCAGRAARWVVRRRASRSRAGSTRCPSVAGAPLTVTRPAATSASAARREATPASARAFEARTGSRIGHLDVGEPLPATSASSGGRSSSDVSPKRSMNSKDVT